MINRSDRQTKSLMIVVLVVVLLISLLITIWYVSAASAQTGGSGLSFLTEGDTGTNWAHVALFFGMMLVGMAAREAYNMLINNKKFNIVSLGIALIVSPIVFGYLYGQLGDLQEITVPTLILSFQNGFFWNSIFESIKSEDRAPKTDSPTLAAPA